MTNNEGYSALLIALLKYTTIDDAFRLLEGETLPKRRKWTPEEIQDIEALRLIGIKWKEIGDIFCVSDRSVNQAYKKAKGGAL